MSARQKFMFDTDFSLAPIKSDPDPKTEPVAEPAEEEEPTPPPPAFTEEELARAREEGYIEGRNAALEDAQSTQENRLSMALEAAVEKFEAIFQVQKTANEETLANAVTVAGVLVRKVLPAYSKAHGLAEIEALAQETLMHVIEEPRIVVHVNGEIKVPLERHISAFAVEKGFEGRLVVIDDPTMAPGDCRIEWEHGGLSRDLGVLWGKIDAIIERNLNRALPAFDETAPEPTQRADTGGTFPAEEVENRAVSDKNDLPRTPQQMPPGSPEAPEAPDQAIPPAQAASKGEDDTQQDERTPPPAERAQTARDGVQNDTAAPMTRRAQTPELSAEGAPTQGK